MPSSTNNTNNANTNPLSFPLGYRWFESAASSRSTAATSSGSGGDNESVDGNGDVGELGVGRRCMVEEEEAEAALAGLEEGDGEEMKDERRWRRRRRAARPKGGKALAEEAEAEGAGGKTVRCCGQPWARRRLAWVVLAAVVGVALLGAGIGLAAYLILLHTTEGPVLSIARCALVDLSFAGSAVNAVVGIEGSVVNRGPYTIWIDAPDIKVYYPHFDNGTYIGTVVFPSLAVAPHGRTLSAANASFFDVNHAGDNVPGQEGLGKQLVAQVLGNQASTLGLQAAVRARANVARGPEARFHMLPRVPVVLHMRCQFTNHWDPAVGPEAAQCNTHLHPFWARIQV